MNTRLDDGERANLIAVSAAGSTSGTTLPQDWQAVCPNPATAPTFGLARTPDGRMALTARGNGRQECFGFLRHRVRLQAGKTYRLRVRLRTQGLVDLNHHLVHGVFAPGWNDGIFAYRQSGEWVTGEARFPGPERDLEGEVRLYLRFSAEGQVWWEHVSLEECEPIPPRLARIAVSWGYNTREGWGRWLDAVGQHKADLALLPEFFHLSAPGGLNQPGVLLDSEPPDGPSAALLAAKARQWGMYTCGTFIERRGDLLYNSAPLFDRKGDLLGVYSKNNVYEPELDQGVTPGIGYPVFQTDFAQVGITICYDSWFPEVYRLLAYQGAELVLLPNAGYYPHLLPARAADNGIWVAVSSANCMAGVWEPGGALAGDPAPNPTTTFTTVRAVERNEMLRFLIATIDLGRRASPGWHGGPLRSAPGGRRNRQTLLVPVEDEVARQARRWREE